jgi:hypothetical protein
MHEYIHIGCLTFPSGCGNSVCRRNHCVSQVRIPCVVTLQIKYQTHYSVPKLCMIQVNLSIQKANKLYYLRTNSINWLVFITEMRCVFCKQRSYFWYITTLYQFHTKQPLCHARISRTFRVLKCDVTKFDINTHVSEEPAASTWIQQLRQKDWRPRTAYLTPVMILDTSWYVCNEGKFVDTPERRGRGVWIGL